MQVRVVETGLNERGHSTVVGDRVVDARKLPTGRVLHGLWSDDHLVTVLDGSGEPGVFPAAGGARFWLFTVPVDDPKGDELGLHETSTVDLGFVVAGMITMELEDGTQVDLRTGDAFVQNGTKHAWHNNGAVDAVVALTVIGM
jgi:hypothetical protein